MNTFAPGFIGLFLIVALLAPSAVTRAAENLDVILIICDDLNGYVEGFAGHAQTQTPNKDGRLSWPEFNAYRAKFDPAKPAQGNPSVRGIVEDTIVRQRPEAGRVTAANNLRMKLAASELAILGRIRCNSGLLAATN